MAATNILHFMSLMPTGRGVRVVAMLRWIAVLLVLVACAGHAAGQGTIGFGNRRTELIPVIENDIKFVQCEFCNLAAKHIHKTVVMMKAAMPSWVKKLPEEAIDALLDQICNTNQETGEWLTKLDVQQEGDALVIKQMPEIGACRLECGTMARLCDDIVVKNKKAVQELLVNRTPKPELQQKLCKEVSTVCVEPPPPYQGEREDEEFKKADEEDLEMMRTMAKMEEQGMSGTLMSREEALKKLEDYSHLLGDDGLSPEDIEKLRKVDPGSIKDEF